MLDGVSSLFGITQATLGVLDDAAPPHCFLSTPSFLCATISSLTTPTVTSETFLPLNIGEWDALPEEDTEPASVSETLGFTLLSLLLKERLLSFVSDHWGGKVLRLGLSSFI